MSKLPVQLTLLIFILALLSGFYMKIPLIDNLIRAFISTDFACVFIAQSKCLPNAEGATLPEAGSTKRECK